MKTIRFGTRFFTAALFLVFSFVILFLSFRIYERESIFIPIAPKNNESEPYLLLAQELEQAMEQSQVQPSRYRVISDRNLFTPERKAWSEPEPEPEEPQELIAKVKRTDVQLYGIFRMKDKKYAILGLPLLKAAYPKFTVLEGETVVSENQDTSSEQKNDEISSYTLMSILDDHVVMKDNTGEKFEVFYEPKNNVTPVSTAAASTSSIVVTSQASSSENSQSGSQVKPISGAVTKKEGAQVDPGLIPKQKREQMIRDGSLIKVKTPFGDMYKYPN